MPMFYARKGALTSLESMIRPLMTEGHQTQLTYMETVLRYYSSLRWKAWSEEEEAKAKICWHRARPVAEAAGAGARQ